MKPIIMDMREITLSKEVYDKEPGKFFTIFIFGILALVLTALAWAYFGHIDIVVRAHGVIRPNAQTVIVINATGGEVREVYFYEGQEVAQGDVLYTVDTFHLENERTLLLGQMNILEFDIATLELFRDSIEAGENLINSFNEEHSIRFDNFMVSLSAIEHGAYNHRAILLEEERGLTEGILYTRFELSALHAFESSISSESDMFSGISAGNSSRRREVLNAFRNQFLQYLLELDMLRLQIENTSTTLEGYQLVRDSVNNQQSAFDGQQGKFAIYRQIYDEFAAQLAQLTQGYNQAYEQHIAYTTLYQAGIATRVEMQAANTRLTNARAQLDEHTAGFLLYADNNIRTAENRLVQLGSQVELLRINNLTSASNQILALENAIAEMDSALAHIDVQQGTVFLVGDQFGDAEMLRLGELNSTLGQISAYQQEMTRLNHSLASVEAQIEDAIVRAPVCGNVMVHTELSGGSFVLGGAQVLSIVPMRGEVLNANIFISNNDIGQIAEGMPVRFDIAALPRRDFGDITGYVTRIATDISSEPGGFGYFLVDTEIEDRVYYSTHGEAVALRVGMAFDARIVVEEQRILFFLLDRLNLLVRP